MCMKNKLFSNEHHLPWNSMTKYLHVALIIFVPINLCRGSIGKPTCNRGETSTSFLDVAVDMISKAKDHLPDCPDACSYSTVKAVDCEELLTLGFNKSGVYTVWPKGRLMEDKSLDVFCDMDTNGGGWTVIQRRGDFLRSKDYFYKDWKSYKKGFGNIEKDFWLGNDCIFSLSNQRLYSLRVDLKDVEGQKKYALYDTFWIDDEAHNYTLHAKDYSGNAGDSLVPKHDNQKFTTKDRKNDNRMDGNCAQLYKGGWWYNECHDSNLNGLYLKGKHESFGDGVIWGTWKGDKESMDTSEMKIRPKNFRPMYNALNNPSGKYAVPKITNTAEVPRT